jgi:CDP-6-deoxy-D-xylo-4-hexulose-3-dehydrase
LVEKCIGRVEIRPIVGGDMTQQPFFKKYMKGFTFNNPNAKLAHEQGLYFGNNPELTKKEKKELIKLFTT